MTDELLPFCECGCGERVTRKGNRFINGHNHKGIKRKPFTPEHRAALSKAKLGVPHTTPAQIAADDAKRGVPRTTPAQIAADEAKRGVPHLLERCAAISDGMKNSDAVKDNAENMIGGNDICDHHYIYDHSDLSKYTMKMTRSRHQRLHWLMRKSNIKVPHINEADNDI